MSPTQRAIDNYANSIREIAVILAAYLIAKKKQRRQRRARKVWVRSYLTERPTHGHYECLMRVLSRDDPELYRNFVRMNEALFNEIVERIQPRLEKQRTFWRKPLDVGLRLAVTLRFLASGCSYKDMAFDFRVAPNTISCLVPETCEAIIAAFGDEVMKCPQSPEEWKDVASVFSKKWNFEHTVGAIDGKHVRIQNPAFGGSLYHNYKKYFSIVLMAIVDADYKFLTINVGAQGSESDGGIFRFSGMHAMFEENTVNLPQPEPLPDGDPTVPVPYFLIGDDAFGLKPWMMKPYPQRQLTKEERIFNYRLSRARRVVENAFGILANRCVLLLYHHIYNVSILPCSSMSLHACTSS